MDDLEFRRRLYAAPYDKQQDIQQALNEDDKRKDFCEQLKNFDAKIAAAMQIDVPENLANQLILRQSLNAHQVTKRKSRIHLSIAASVAFVVGVTVTFLNSSPAFTSVADYSLAHYHHEATNFPKQAKANFSLASINNEMTDLKVSFIEQVGKLIAIDGCFFDGMDSMHLVFEGEYDNVTVFIVPKSEHLSFTKNFSDDSVQGLTRQYPNGDVIIIGNKNEPLELWRDKLDNTIEWSI